jgi:hypothetical protein
MCLLVCFAVEYLVISTMNKHNSVHLNMIVAVIIEAVLFTCKEPMHCCFDVRFVIQRLVMLDCELR